MDWGTDLRISRTRPLPTELWAAAWAKRREEGSCARIAPPLPCLPLCQEPMAEGRWVRFFQRTAANPRAAKATLEGSGTAVGAATVPTT